MATTYNQTTFLEAKDRLASLLNDESKVFWTDTELGLYIIEALRFWGLAAQYWRDSAKFETVAGQAMYDLTTDVTDVTGSVLMQDLTVTDRDLIVDLEYNLMEPITTNWGLGWQGSEMFTMGEIANLLALGRDDLLRQSGCIAAGVQYTATAGNERVELSQDTIHILRMSVQEEGSTSVLPMWPIDYYQAQAYNQTAFPATGRPNAYITTYTPTLAVDIYPSPRTQSVLRLDVVKSGSNFTPEVAAGVVGLPDDACWLAKYRGLDDLLSGDGLSRAPELSQYARQRWQDGLEMLAQYQSLMWSTINGKRMTISSLAQLSAQRPDWEGSSGTPRSLHMLNWNRFAVYPVPDGVYSIELEVVKKAPVPTDDADYIQVGREQMQAIYDYAQHLALLKCQGAEFTQSYDLLQSATEAAKEHMAALAGSAINWVQQQRLTQEDRLMRPYRRRELVATADAMAKEKS
jgi:hypothetical protein